MSVIKRLSTSCVGGAGAVADAGAETAPICAVAVLVTESCASVLGAAQELTHIQDVGDNWCKSLISLPRAFSASGTAQLLRVYSRRHGADAGKETAPICAVAVLVTESCASVLGAAQELTHIQDVGDNWCKSLISLPRAFSASGTAQLLRVYSRRHGMSLEDTSVNSSFHTSEEGSHESSTVLEENDAISGGPVQQVRSVAHDNRLGLSERGSHVLVRVLDDAASCTDSDWHNFCRICHGGESIEELVAPCKCRGSVDLTHITCLERWLKESGSDACELCNQRFKVLRYPRYPFLQSIFVWATDRTAHGPHLFSDIAAFCLYTPSAMIATYLLMMPCDCAAKLHLNSRERAAHVVTFNAIAGSVALTHITCLERWLKESGSDACELCNQRFKVLRCPRYPFLQSIFVWATDRTAHGPHLFSDIAAFCLYTPSAMIATYLLMMLCDCAAKLHLNSRERAAHVVAFSAIAGMAAIDFTYSSWLMACLQRHVHDWKEWFNSNCQLTIILPPRKRRKPKLFSEIKVIEDFAKVVETSTTTSSM